MEKLFDICWMAYAFSSFALVGLIWTIQLVHYPTFRYVTGNDFQQFEEFHTKKITLVVGPLMLVELASLTYLFVINLDLFWGIQWIMLALIWISTLVFSIPCHHQLHKQKDLATIKKLIQTNWIRTILWSVKALWPISYIYSHLS